MNMTVDSLMIEVQAPTAAAEKCIDDLSNSLNVLKNATKGLGLNGVSKQFTALGTALNKVSVSSEKLNEMANALEKVASCGNIKISSSVANRSPISV